MNPRPVLLSRRIIDINIYTTFIWIIMTVSYSNSDATSRMLKVMSNGLKRMTDSELEITAIKLQEYFALRLGYSNFALYSGPITYAPYGAIIMTSLNRGGDSSVRSFKVDDTKYNATVSSKSNNAFDNFADDDDTFSDPGNISTSVKQSFYLAQKHFANYGTGTPDFNGQPLQGGGDYYNLIRNWNGIADLSSTVTNKWSGMQPAEMIRDYGHLTATTSGNVQVEKDVQKIYEAIFKFINARIRSTDSNKNFGQYRISTSWPGNGYFVVREINGLYQQYYYYAFTDTVSSVNNAISYFYNLDAFTTRFEWALYLSSPTTTYGSGYHYGQQDQPTRPTRMSRWKITVHSGSALEGTNSGDVREFFATGDYNVHGKYFYFKPVSAQGSQVYVSSDYTTSTPSASSFEGSGRTVNIIYGDSGSASPSIGRTALLAPSGNSADGQIYLYNSQKYRDISSYSTSTVYKCERIDRLIEMDLPYIADYDQRYDWTTYIGHPSPNHEASINRRKDHYQKAYIINLLYNLYTLGMYYPVYSLSTGVNSGQFNHGNFSNSIRAGSGSNTVYGPSLFSGGDESGTYYKVRGAGGASTYETTNYYLVSEEV